MYYPDSKVHEANMGPTWDQQDPGGPHVGPMNIAICVLIIVHPMYFIFTHIFLYKNDMVAIAILTFVYIDKCKSCFPYLK